MRSGSAIMECVADRLLRAMRHWRDVLVLRLLADTMALRYGGRARSHRLQGLDCRDIGDGRIFLDVLRSLGKQRWA